MNQAELLRLKKILEELFDHCKNAHYAWAIRKVTLGLFPMIWEKIEEKLKNNPPANESSPTRKPPVKRAAVRIN